MLDRQHVLTTAVTGILAQGKPGYDRAHDICRYRTGDGSACALGQLIPTERYSPDLEAYSLSNADLLSAMGLPGVITAEEEVFLAELQCAHDNAAVDRDSGFIDSFLTKVREIAVHNNLEMPPHA